MTDLTYIQDDMFTRFIPASDAGENIWRQLAAQNDGVAAVFNHHAKSVIAQIRKAGYSVAKSKPVKDSEIEDILRELEA